MATRANGQEHSDEPRGPAAATTSTVAAAAKGTREHNFVSVAAPCTNIRSKKPTSREPSQAKPTASTDRGRNDTVSSDAVRQPYSRIANNAATVRSR